MRKFKTYNEEVLKSGFTKTEEDILNYQTEIVVNYLFDNLISDDELTLDNIKGIIKESFKLKYTNNYGDDELIFSYDDYSFDRYSSEVLNRTIKYLDDYKEDKNVFNAIGLLNDLLSNDKSKKQDIIDSVIEQDNIRFITIPAGKVSILDYDTEYNGTRVTFNGKTFQTSTPFDGNKASLTDASGTSGYKLYEILLTELNAIEKSLISNPNIGDGRFRREGNNGFVNKDTNNFIRIHINQYGSGKGKVFAIGGIFKKINDPQNKIFEEYGNRVRILTSMSQDKNVSIEECEKAYQDFKKKLIKMKYDQAFRFASEIYDVVVAESKEDKREV